MTGIIAPSIVNYDWTVKQTDPSFLNVSFPFRVKIEKIWFTTQAPSDGYGLWHTLNGESGDMSVDIETTERLLRLAAFKSKNSKTQHGQYDNPTELMSVFNDAGWNGNDIDETLKPTMWLGNPDDAAGRIGAFSTSGGVWGSAPSLRSTAVAPIDKAHATNSSWSESEYNANTYLADVAIMNTDEMLQLFVYNADGDWTDYNELGKVTISVAYTGMHDEDAASATAKTWTDWWND
jgi:hypothetical protein